MHAFGYSCISEMASGFRGLCRLAAVISLRRSAPSVLPQGRNLTTVSLPPASRIANTSKLRPPSVFQTRCYADTLTGPELTERVLTVLKTFDKIDPTKVSTFVIVDVETWAKFNQFCVAIYR